MKKFLALILSAVCVLSMAACGSDNTASDTSDLSYVQGKGTLVVGITDFEPMDYKDESGNWVGLMQTLQLPSQRASA